MRVASGLTSRCVGLMEGRPLTRCPSETLCSRRLASIFNLCCFPRCCLGGAEATAARVIVINIVWLIWLIKQRGNPPPSPDGGAAATSGITKITSELFRSCHGRRLISRTAANQRTRSCWRSAASSKRSRRLSSIWCSASGRFSRTSLCRLQENTDSVEALF